ncbi:DUF6175 family protein [Jiulongibacter sediminis]|uniref:DUF6175 family protein n=1 Tax=Jiulongibacter sediminis TaxID=1605367 RepID=UPI0026E953FE|nr:DUF6175 family protein [Jiulongibacter sediminis]
MRTLKTLFRRNLLLILLSLSFSTAFSQAKKPTLMILPSDNWCNQRFFMETYDDQGTKKKTPNYKQAFQEDTELAQVIAKIGEFMIKKGYELKDVEQSLKNLDLTNAEESVTRSSTSNSQISESPLDKLKKRVKADIVIQLWWEVNNVGNGHVVRYTLDAFDSYTNKRIASSTGNSENSTKFVPDLILEAAKNNMNLFLTQVQNHFDNMKSNGREIVVRVQTWDNLNINLETEFNNKELSEYIIQWMKQNTVKGNFNTTDATSNFMLFEQVKIPLYNQNNEQLDAREFVNNLRKYLNSSPFNITCKLVTRGLGEAILVLGEK